MSRAVAVYHGRFGRASLYFLDRPMTKHVHRDGHLIFHVRGPSQYLHVWDRRYEISLAQGVAVNTLEPHSYQPVNFEGQLMLVIYIKPQWFSTYGGCGVGGLRFWRPEIEVNAPMARRITQVVALLRQDAAPGLFDGHLFDLVHEASAQTQSCRPAASLSAQPNGRISDFRVRKSLNILSQSLCSEIDLSLVACEAGLSRPHFFKLFRDQLGVPPKLFWNSLRMEHAIERLTSTTQSITEISLDMGFSSQCSFSRFFAANVGIAPTEYRRAARLMPA